MRICRIEPRQSLHAKVTARSIKTKHPKIANAETKMQKGTLKDWHS
jgi:hypothetical protein